MTRDQFQAAMSLTIRRGIQFAWWEGAKACGIQPSELSPEETNAMQVAVFEEVSHISSFAQSIEEGSREEGGLLRVALRRAELWVERYQDVVQRAKVMACADRKLKWVYDPSKENCSTCAKLNGKVKRASYWEAAGIQPKNPPNPALRCGGWRCGCVLEPTDERASPGPLPNVP